MVQDFYDRFVELKNLKERYESLAKGEFIVLYGRRRLGKTALIFKFFQNVKCKHAYFFVGRSSKNELMLQFSADIKNQIGDDVKIASWNDFFEYVSRESGKDRFVLAIDEFQNFKDNSPDFITSLQRWWDTLKAKKLMIILSGSAMGMMHELIFSSAGPLYARATQKYKLTQFRYVDFREMFKHIQSEEDKVKFFATFGGTPFYLEQAKAASKELFGTINAVLLSNTAILKDEPTNLLSFELKDPARYNSILHGISAGKVSLNELADFAGVKSSDLSPYTRKLEELLDLVVSYRPLLGKGRTRYDFKDNFFRFWYRFIFPNRTAIEFKNSEFVMGKIQKEFDGYAGRAFENIVKELLIAFNTEKIKDYRINFTEMGSWWNRIGDEIDIVARGKPDTIVCSVKWQNKEQGESMFYDIERVVSKEKIFKGKVKFLLVSKSGFTQKAMRVMEDNNVLYLTLKDMTMLFDSIAEKERQRQRTLVGYFE